MNTWCKVFRRSPCALVPPHTCAHASTEPTGSSRLCGLRAQRLDSPTDTQRPLLPGCARKFAKRGRAQGSRRYACVGAERSGGGASVCAEGTNEKAGKDGMERQGVRCTCFLRAGGGLTGRERQRSWASPTNPRPAACLLPSRPLLARLGPDFLTDLPGSD